jgi:tRNA pseudouridine38-40 synthase
MPRNFRLTIEYDGTDFHGWQRQKADRSVQDCIEQALTRIARTKVTLHGAGRTDAGVHALGQVASFAADIPIEPAALRKALNSLLPEDIAIHDCRHVEPGFHARFSACSKVYEYRILNRGIPPAVGRRYVWHIRRHLDLGAMQSAVKCIVGRQDFSSFEGAGSPRRDSVRRVIAAKWSTPGPDRLLFQIEADGFLRHMVRNLVGTLVEVGSRRRDPESMRNLLAMGDRRQAGATAPASGLFLVEVRY